MRKNFLKSRSPVILCSPYHECGNDFCCTDGRRCCTKALEEEKAAAFPVGVYNARNVDHFTGIAT